MKKVKRRWPKWQKIKLRGWVLYFSHEFIRLKHKSKLHFERKKKYNNMGCIVWDLIIGMTYPLIEIVSKNHGWININSENKILVGVEFKSKT